MEDSHESSEEIRQLKNELFEQVKEANDILGILKPIIQEGEKHKELFRDLYTNIENAHNKIGLSRKEISSSKTSNTKYSNDLKDTKEKIKKFIEEVKQDEKGIKNLLKNIRNSEKIAMSGIGAIGSFKKLSLENKKIITDAKNTAQNISKKIIAIEESISKILGGMRDDKAESKRIVEFLKDKEKKGGDFYSKISSKYIELFNAEEGEGKMSRVDELTLEIKNIKDFDSLLEDEIKPRRDSDKKYVDSLKDDIEKKRQEVSSLLSDAAAKTLNQGYLESMEEYSQKKSSTFRKNYFNKDCLGNKRSFFIAIVKSIWGVILTIWHTPFNIFFRHSRNIFNYVLFIAPLVIIFITFVSSDALLESNFLKILKLGASFGNGDNESSLIFYRFGISLPLAWVAWFGQRNISQRKRMFEEYNHKHRVVNMYLMFNESSTYVLSDDNKERLQKVLLNTIEKNPAKNLGGNETMMDKFFEKMKIKEFYEKAIEVVKEEVLNTAPKDILKNIDTKN